MNTNAITPLATSDLRKAVPAAFADAPKAGVSEKYQFVSTEKLVETLADTGYLPVSAGQSRTRTPSGHLFTKHVIRLQHRSHMNRVARAVGDVIPQIILTNSHDRTSAFHLSAGLFRLVCKNGMAVNAGEFATARVLHNDPRIHDLIVEGVKSIEALTGDVVVPQIDRMTRLELTESQVQDFAQAATVLRHGEVKPAEAALWLQIRRDEDAARNLWAVMNRIQENAVKGGYEFQDAAGRNRTARGIQSVSADLEFNMRLWSLSARVLDTLTA